MLRLLQLNSPTAGRSAWSCANVSGFVTVDDVSRDDAMAYLAGRGLGESDAASIYRIAGGSIGLLSHLATSVADMGIDCKGRKDCIAVAGQLLILLSIGVLSHMPTSVANTGI